jgi:hypothetical protein
VLFFEVVKGMITGDTPGVGEVREVTGEEIGRS